MQPSPQSTDESASSLGLMSVHCSLSLPPERDDQSSESLGSDASSSSLQPERDGG